MTLEEIWAVADAVEPCPPFTDEQVALFRALLRD